MGLAIQVIYGFFAPYARFRRAGPSPAVRSAAAKKFAADVPKCRKKLLIDRTEEVARPERAARTAGLRPDHALNELHMLESPLPELLLVLEQCFREEEQD